MNKKLPILKPKEVLRALQKAGFYIDTKSGSHFTLLNDRTKKRVTVSMHSKDMKRGTLHSILKESGLTLEEFLDLL